MQLSLIIQQSFLSDLTCHLIFLNDNGQVDQIIKKPIKKTNSCVPFYKEPLAYMIFTSGTTGTPKSVIVPHKSIVSNIESLKEIFRVTCRDVVYLSSPSGFDPSVVQMFLAFSAGSALFIENPTLDTNKLTNCLVNNNVSILQGKIDL